MTAGRLSRVTGVSALVFVVLLAVLTLHRWWDAALSTEIQSLIVQVTALLVTVGVAVYASRGGSFVAAWTLAFGPSLAFTLNLFVPVSTMGPLLKVTYAVASAAVVSGAVALAGFVAGRGLELLAKAGRTTSEP